MGECLVVVEDIMKVLIVNKCECLVDDVVFDFVELCYCVWLYIGELVVDDVVVFFGEWVEYFGGVCCFVGFVVIEY